MSPREMRHHLGEQIGEFVAVGLPIALGIYFAIRMTRRRDDNKVTAWPVVVGLAVSLLMLGGSLSRNATPAGNTIAATDDPGPWIVGNVRVDKVVTGPAEGFPKFTPGTLKEYAKNYGASIAQPYAQQLGKPIDPNSVISTSVLRHMGQQDVVRTMVAVQGTFYLIQVAGVSGDREVNLLCRSQTPDRFELAGSECERRAIETFGPGNLNG